jgi:carnitine-CoA ligase
MDVANNRLARDQDTINAALERATAQWPDRVFLDVDGREYTFAQVDRESSRIAHGLSTLGVKAGDTVTTILDNNVDAVLVWLGINKLGAISVPVNTAYKGEFLRHQLADSASGVVIAESDYAERVCFVAADLPELHTLLHRGEVPKATAAGKKIAPLDEYRLAQSSRPAITVRC